MAVKPANIQAEELTSEQHDLLKKLQEKRKNDAVFASAITDALIKGNDPFEIFEEYGLGRPEEPIKTGENSGVVYFQTTKKVLVH